MHHFFELHRIKLNQHTVLVFALLVHSLSLAWGSCRHSPTIDEPAYLTAGLSHWQLGRFDLCKVSPPLGRLVGAIPVVYSEPVYNWDGYQIGFGVRDEHRIGGVFVNENRSRIFWLFALARWGCIPFSILGAIVCYRWGCDLYGARAGLAGCILWCFSPNILAHGQLMTPDVGVTALSVAACYAYWKWHARATWSRCVIAGVTLGLAVLAKTNAVVLFAALPLAIVLNRFSDRETVWLRQRFWQVVTVPFVAAYILNLGYGFEGSFTLLGRYEFVSQTFGGSDVTTGFGNRFGGTILEHVPVPLPRAFLEGIDLQKRDFENIRGLAKTYYRGRWFDHGWWWYYFYVVAVKTPVALWLLAGLCLCRRFLSESRGLIDSGEAFLIAPGLMLFGLACSQTGFGHSLRYILPAFPFAFIIVASVFSVRPDPPGRLRKVRFEVAFLAYFICSSIAVFPHSLAYFNEAVGGPFNGHAHLLDGNMDWGEDFIFLSEWIDEHPDLKPLYVAYWGSSAIEKLGVDFKRPPVINDAIQGGREPGWYAISVSHLRGDYRRSGNYTDFLERTPVAHIGYTIYVYHITAPPAVP